MSLIVSIGSMEDHAMPVDHRQIRKAYEDCKNMGIQPKQLLIGDVTYPYHELNHLQGVDRDGAIHFVPPLNVLRSLCRQPIACHMFFAVSNNLPEKFRPLVALHEITEYGILPACVSDESEYDEQSETVAHGCRIASERELERAREELRSPEELKTYIVLRGRYFSRLEMDRASVVLKNKDEVRFYGKARLAFFRDNPHKERPELRRLALLAESAELWRTEAARLGVDLLNPLGAPETTGSIT